MSDPQQQLRSLIRQCSELMSAARPRGGRFDDPSESTQTDYVRLATTLLIRSRETGIELKAVVNDTTSPRTFQKRMAAFRYFLRMRYRLLIYDLREGNDGQRQRLLPEMQQFMEVLQAFTQLQKTGLQGTRRKRNSKRQALSGLPDDWRNALYERSKTGKYGLAILAASLSGCRPAELQKGIRIWRTYDARLQSDVINLEIKGVKVKATQGQPHRLIQYRVLDPHPLIVAMNSLIDQQPQQALQVQIPSRSNFTVEIRRLSKSLWPAHPHAITAYCFRHQWAADAKRTQPADSVSQGLGHLSAKTRSNYGQAQQARQTGMLDPLAISAERSVRPMSREAPTRVYRDTHTPDE